MNSFIFEPDENGIWKPSDLGKGEEWIEVLEKIGVDSTNNITSEQAFAGAIVYLEYHKKEYNFEVQSILNLLYSMKKDPLAHKDLWDKWNEIIEKSPQIPFGIKTSTSNTNIKD